MPDVCYRLKGRLVKFRPDGQTHEMILRAFEGKIGDNIFKCDNDGCCSNSKGVFDSSAGNASGDSMAIIEAFKKCGLSLAPSYEVYGSALGLRSSCIVDTIYGPDTAGFLGKGKFNFDLVNPSSYYKGPLFE